MSDQPARRVRTQAERDADGTTWRATADTRPGYATYPTTPPGNPSWWRHDPGRGLSPIARVMAGLDHPGPPPVDGETCAKWCGFCHLNNGDRPPAFDPQTMSGTRYAQQLRDAGITLDEMERVVREDIWIVTEQIAPPRRRWWHRYTRRNV